MRSRIQRLKTQTLRSTFLLWTKKVQNFLYLFSNSRPLCGFYHFEMIDVWLEKDWHGMLFFGANIQNLFNSNLNYWIKCIKVLYTTSYHWGLHYYYYLFCLMYFFFKTIKIKSPFYNQIKKCISFKVATCSTYKKNNLSLMCTQLKKCEFNKQNFLSTYYYVSNLFR